MATHFNIVAWKIPWSEEPGRLQSMGLQRVRHDWVTEHANTSITAGYLNLGHCMKSELLKCKTCVQCWASEKHWLRSPTEDLSHTLHRILTTNWLSNLFPYSTCPQRWGLEKEMATHSSILAWRIPWTEEPGGLLPMGSHRVGHDWSDLAAAAAARGSEIPRNFFYPSLLNPPTGPPPRNILRVHSVPLLLDFTS